MHQKFLMVLNASKAFETKPCDISDLPHLIACEEMLNFITFYIFHLLLFKFNKFYQLFYHDSPRCEECIHKLILGMNAFNEADTDSGVIHWLLQPQPN